MTRALILAGGEGKRWANYLGVPQHLIPIKGEPLLHRTQRLLHERGVEDIRVVCKPRDRNRYVMPYARHEPMRYVEREWEQEQESSRHAWNIYGKTIILYGDVYFTEPLLDAITADSGDPWKVYARWSGSEITGKGYGEMFGWVFNLDAHAVIDAARDNAIAHVEDGRWWRALGWEVFRDAIGLPIPQYGGGSDSEHAVDWSDASDDFDHPKDWDVWQKLNPHLA